MKCNCDLTMFPDDLEHPPLVFLESFEDFVIPYFYKRKFLFFLDFCHRPQFSLENVQAKSEKKVFIILKLFCPGPRYRVVKIKVSQNKNYFKKLLSLSNFNKSPYNSINPEQLEIRFSVEFFYLTDPVYKGMFEKHFCDLILYSFIN